MVVTNQYQVHVGFQKFVEEVLAHRTVAIVGHGDTLLVDPRDDPRDARISGIRDGVLDPLRMR